MQDLDDVIEELHKKGYSDDDIVIISCSTTEKTMYDIGINNLYKSKYKFTTARKFKGLESNAVILVDISAELLKKDPLVFYVGASRARMDLELLVSLTDEECSDIYYLYADKKPIRRVRQSLKKLLMTV